MGYDRHHAIVVTSFDSKAILRARATALDYGCTISSTVESRINHWESFLVAPDGSKEGWPQSDEGDQRREEFIAWLNEQAFEDGSTLYDWVEIQYGDDDGDNRVLQTDRDHTNRVRA